MVLPWLKLVLHICLDIIPIQANVKITPWFNVLVPIFHTDIQDWVYYSTTIFIPSSALDTRAIPLKIKEAFNVLTKIYFVSGLTYSCQRTLNHLCLRWWHFVIKSIQFQCSKFSKVAKMIYNSILNACSVVLVLNLAKQSLIFDHKLCANVTKINHIFYNGCMALTWF